MPDPAVDMARSRTTLIPSESSASGFRRVIEIPPGDGKKKRGGLLRRSQRPEEYRDHYEQGLQVGGPAVESYYPTVPPTTYPSEEIPMQSLGASDPIYGGGGGIEGGGLSWNERRKIENYAKRVDKDNRRKAKDEAKFKEEAEKRAAIEERKRMKDQEKELQAYRKASTHSRWNIFRSPTHTHHPGPPPTIMVTPYSSGPQGSAWQTYTNTPGYAAPTNRPLPAIRSGDTYTALSLPIHPPASTSIAVPGGQALAPFDGYGVRKVGEPGMWTGMSRTMTHALVGMEHDQYVSSGQRGFIA